MVDVVDVVNQIAAAQSSDAKDSLHNLLSQKAMEALDGKKQEIAKNLFSNGETPPVADDDGNIDVEVQDTADTPVEEPETNVEVEEQPEEEQEQE
jgi:hypothetical protein